MRLPHGQTLPARMWPDAGRLSVQVLGRATQTYGDIVFQPDALPDDVAARPLSDDQKGELLAL